MVRLLTDTAPSPSSLLEGLRSGDPGAKAALFDTYAAHVQRVLVRILGTHAEHADLLSEVFLRAFARACQVESDEGIKPWLTAMAVFVAREHIRYKRRRRWLVFLPPDELPQADVAPPEPDGVEALFRVYKALDQLNVEERVAFSLRYLEQMELSEAAAACSVSLATLKRRLARAEKQFLAISRRDPVLIDWLRGGTRWVSE